MIIQVARIGNNINQIAKHVNIDKVIDCVVLKQIIDINKKLDNLMLQKQKSKKLSMLVKFFKTKKWWQYFGYQLSFVTNKLEQKIRKSFIVTRAMSRATIEFKEVARKYALDRIQKDVKIDVDSAKKRDIGGMGFDF